MTFQIYTSGKIDFKINEKRQFDRIKKKMTEEFKNDETRYCLIVDHIIGSQQYDLILLKNDAIISIDLKGYTGTIRGGENGPWFAITSDYQEIEIKQDKNPFIQARDQRYQLMHFLNDTLPSINSRFEENKIHNLSAVVCFENGSTYDPDQIDVKSKLWFNVTNELNLVSLIANVTSREFYLKDNEIDQLLEKMNVHKSEEEPKLDIPSKSVLNIEDIESISDRIDKKLKNIGFNLETLSKFLDIDIAARYLEEARDKKIIEKDEEEDKFYLVKNWNKTIPNENEDEDYASEHDLHKYSQNDFWLKPNKSETGKEYMGVYRGTKYHIDYKKNVWWRPNRSVSRIPVKFANEDILDKIIEIKPQGGSFRITEDKEVLTKTFLHDGGYISVFVGKIEDDLSFDNFQWEPENIKKGWLWPSIYDGTKFSVNTNNQLLMHIGEQKVYAKEGHEELTKKVLDFIGKQGGGSFRINENGHMITLMYKAPYPDKIKKQLEELSPEEKNLIDIRKQTEKDDRVPIYIGKFRGNIKFKKIFDIHTKWTKEHDEEFLKRIGG